MIDERDPPRTGGLSTIDAEPADALVTDPRVLAWDRYEVLDPLGEGGMGIVYKARDRQLDRIVAIKFALGSAPRLEMRFQREAYAQARIKHPNVCAVYDVGAVGGRVYIALQFVDGEPLDKAAVQMPVRGKVAVMRSVAEGIHEAHRLGVIHRDIKPANVLVEHRGDGSWLPVITDFGLARETTVDLGLTRTGALLGTPAYMAPEQARGDNDAVDRRSDVYGLGATLYELLTGRPPFVEASLAQLLAKVIHEDPPPPRSLVPDVPPDLEIITLKCLSKDPAQRYESARALADDLDRHLEGESILGRRPSRWRSLKGLARRNRRVLVVAALSLAALLVVGAFGVREWLASRVERARTTERTLLAQRLGQQSKDIQLFMRGVYLLPLQDTRPARDDVRRRIRAIAATEHDLGALGDALLHDAVGRGRLALHEWKLAADELGRVTDAGLGGAAEAHLGRGRALGELYHRELEDARRSGGPAWLNRRRQQLERQYLTPALAELAASRDSNEGAVLLEALISLYRGDFAAAEKIALAASASAPWLFEAWKLAADAVYGAALVAFDRGDYDAARTGLARADELYARASEIGRSDATIYQAWAQSSLQRAELETRRGGSAREPLERALDAIDRALLADPDDARAYTTKAYVLMRWFRIPSLYRPDEGQALVTRSAEAAQHAVDLDRGDAAAWDALGNAHVLRGLYESLHGGEGSASLRLAIGELGHALALRPEDPWVHNDLGVAHRWLGASLDDAGGDPIPEYEAALRSYVHATEVDPDYVYAWSNQADLHATLAEHDAASRVDPRAEVQASRTSGERCLYADPHFGNVLVAMARAQLAFASYQLATGEEPTEALHRTRDLLDRAERLHGSNAETWNQRLDAARIAATYWVGGGRSKPCAEGEASRALEEGRNAFSQILRINPASADAYVGAARLDLAEATRSMRARHDARPLLTRALAHAQRAISLDRRLADACAVAAEVCLRLAAAGRSHAMATLGLTYARQALTIRPSLVDAQVLRDELAQR